ncbi:MAG: biotin--[acetyl-CoA-carboxylase] ligase [Candidatus Thorarchaeota archaeon]|nr:biotin--[acetyl-CoA-carboxylase] ligase [Candidatus Thorarchaeota archaeon]
MFEPRLIMDGLRTKHIKPRIRHFSKLDSTNETTKKAALDDGRPGLLVIADEQMAGKGRMNRTWVSPPGGLYFSLFLESPLEGTPAPILGMLVACGVTEAIRQVTGIDPSIKWPNDIIIDGKKAGGILCEAVSRDNVTRKVVIGVGINLNTPISSFSARFRYPATSLIEVTGREVSREELLRSILLSVDKRIGIVKENQSYNDTIEEWKWINNILGYPVVVDTGNERIEGTAIDIREDGALIVETGPDSHKPITIGDVTRVTL